MGLAGRKQKQRIPTDPRNLSWADDASRFGLAYLSKFGWDASQGLGSSGDGMKSHLRVQQKLDMMGIGAQHRQDPNGIAWKQNKDFEVLLKRLNESAEKESGTDSEEREEDHRRASGSALANAFVHAQESPVAKKKRKREHNLVGGDTKKKPKKQESREKSSPGDSSTSTNTSSDPLSLSSIPELHSEAAPKPRPMAHRARLRAAKRIADKSASAIAEVLGITPSSASTSDSTPVPTPHSSTPDQPSHSLDNLTTSTKSVADYFKEKLRARSSSSTSSLTPSVSATSDPGSIQRGPGVSPLGDEDELPRGGIGSKTFSVPPPLQMPSASSTPLAAESRLDSRDTLAAEKQPRMVERKAKRQKQRESELARLHPREDVQEKMAGMRKERANSNEDAVKRKGHDAENDLLPKSTNADGSER